MGIQHLEQGKSERPLEAFSQFWLWSLVYAVCWFVAGTVRTEAFLGVRTLYFSE